MRKMKNERNSIHFIICDSQKHQIHCQHHPLPPYITPIRHIHTINHTHQHSFTTPHTTHITSSTIPPHHTSRTTHITHHTTPHVDIHTTTHINTHSHSHLKSKFNGRLLSPNRQKANHLNEKSPYPRVTIPQCHSKGGVTSINEA